MDFWIFYHDTNEGSGSPKAMVYLWLLVPCDQEAKCFGYRVKLDEGNDKSHLRKMHSLATLHQPFWPLQHPMQKKTLK